MDLCLAFFIVAATILAYSPVRHNEFVTFDDPAYLTANHHVQAGLTWDSARWAVTATRDANWFPLTWLSHMADVQVFGMEPGWHHAVNVAIHAISALLLFVWLGYATAARWPSALVALLFAIHPLHVESVAWASERKDVLSGLFWMLTLWGYVYYTRRPGWRRYVLVLVPFALGLMSKPMIVTLPFVLLLLDVWPLGRLSEAEASNLRKGPHASGDQWSRRFRPSGRDIRRLLVEKFPLFLLATASAIVTFLVQQGAGSVAALQQVPVGVRVANAVVSYGAYLRAFAWPSGLAAFYPYQFPIPAWQVALSAAVVAAACALAWMQRTARPYLAVGWCWFLGTLVPVIGLVQVGEQAHADRYMYVPLVGLSIALAWTVADMVRRRPGLRVPLVASAVVACCACATLAWLQVQYWRNDSTLFEHALAVTRNNQVAHDGVGRALRTEGRIDDAIGHFRESVRIQPRYAGSRANLGEALLAQGRTDEAIEQLEEAVRLGPDLREAHVNLAAALRAAGRRSEAAAEYAGLLQRWPEDATARAGFGLLLAENGEPERAGGEIREAIRLAPQLADPHYNLARVLVTLGRFQEAAAEFSEALRIKPEFAEGHFNLANVLAQLGRMDEAIGQYHEAVRLKPDDVNARSNLGTALATVGRFDEAIAQFTEALRLRPDFTPARTNLESARQAQAQRGRDSTSR